MCLSASIWLLLISSWTFPEKNFKIFPSWENLKMASGGVPLLHASLISLLGENYCASLPLLEVPLALEVLKRGFYADHAPLDVPLNIFNGSIFSFSFFLDMCNISGCSIGKLHFEKACELLVIAALMFPSFQFWKYKQNVKSNNFIAFNESFECFQGVIFHFLFDLCELKESSAWVILVL